MPSRVSTATECRCRNKKTQLSHKPRPACPAGRAPRRAGRGPTCSGVFGPEPGDRVLPEPCSDVTPSRPPCCPWSASSMCRGGRTRRGCWTQRGHRCRLESLPVLPAWWRFLFSIRLLLPVTVVTGDPTPDLGLHPWGRNDVPWLLARKLRTQRRPGLDRPDLSDGGGRRAPRAPASRSP